ncbi:hypothetical protein [Nocardia sp. NPDC051833]|uniref:hypothetical protein n=1 Tax=Nocardia sp. NPDC051833 TaxID=3155674 RepID=UPI00341DFED9
MTDETPKYANGGVIRSETFPTNESGQPEPIVSSCGYWPWHRTEEEGDDEPRE